MPQHGSYCSRALGRGNTKKWFAGPVIRQGNTVFVSIGELFHERGQTYGLFSGPRVPEKASGTHTSTGDARVAKADPGRVRRRWLSGFLYPVLGQDPIQRSDHAPVLQLIFGS